jgi:hypothetical protein
VGALLYLWVEPRPLWPRRRSAPNPDSRIGGVAGFCLALLLSLLVSLLGLGFHALVNADSRNYQGLLIVPVVRPG